MNALYTTRKSCCRNAFHAAGRLCIALACTLLTTVQYAYGSTLAEEYDNGLKCYKLELYDCAIKHFQKVIEISPNNVSALLHLGYSYGEQGKNESAIGCFAKVLSIQPNNYNALFNMGIVYQNIGDFSQAEYYYDKTLENSPNSAVGYSKLATQYAELKKYEKSTFCKNKSIASQISSKNSLKFGISHQSNYSGNNGSRIKYYRNTNNEYVQSPTYYNAAPAGASALCRDGTYSFSRNRRGTCSHHGGVAKWY